MKRMNSENKYLQYCRNKKLCFFRTNCRRNFLRHVRHDHLCRVVQPAVHQSQLDEESLHSRILNFLRVGNLLGTI